MAETVQETPNRGLQAKLAVGVVAAIVLVLTFVPIRRDDLTITFTRGEVSIQTRDGTWATADSGQTVSKNQRIRVGGDASVNLAVPDGHDVTIADPATLHVTDNSRPLFGEMKLKLRLEEGRARVSGEGEGGSFDLSTPHTVAGIRGTVFVAAVESGGTAISQQQGAVELLDSSGEVTPLGPGQGAVTAGSGAAVRDLPPSPQITEPAPGALIGDSTTLLRWSPVEGASDYAAEFARDAGFTQIMGRVITDVTEMRVPVIDEDMPVFVRVSASTADGLESAPGIERLLHVRLRFRIGQTLQENGQIEESIAELQAALPNYSTDTRLLKDLGWSLYLAERLEESRDAYQAAQEIDPGDHETALELGRVLFWLEDFSEAEAAYRVVLDEAPEDADALWGLGDVMAATGRVDEAERLFLQALEIDPAHPYAGQSLERLREAR